MRQKDGIEDKEDQSQPSKYVESQSPSQAGTFHRSTKDQGYLVSEWKANAQPAKSQITLLTLGQIFGKNTDACREAHGCTNALQCSNDDQLDTTVRETREQNQKACDKCADQVDVPVAHMICKGPREEETTAIRQSRNQSVF